MEPGLVMLSSMPLSGTFQLFARTLTDPRLLSMAPQILANKPLVCIWDLGSRKMYTDRRVSAVGLDIHLGGTEAKPSKRRTKPQTEAAHAHDGLIEDPMK